MVHIWKDTLLKLNVDRESAHRLGHCSDAFFVGRTYKLCIQELNRTRRMGIGNYKVCREKLPAGGKDTIGLGIIANDGCYLVAGEHPAASRLNLVYEGLYQGVASAYEPVGAAIIEGGDKGVIGKGGLVFYSCVKRIFSGQYAGKQGIAYNRRNYRAHSL